METSLPVQKIAPFGLRHDTREVVTLAFRSKQHDGFPDGKIWFLDCPAYVFSVGFRDSGFQR